MKRRQRRQRRRNTDSAKFDRLLLLVASLVFLLTSTSSFYKYCGVQAANDDYYAADDDGQAAADDDGAAAADDDGNNDDGAAAAADDDDGGGAQGDDANGDDDNAGGGGNDDDGGNGNGQQNDDGNYYQDDDKFPVDDDTDWGRYSVMPVSCINYNKGHVIKFDFFDESESSYQCHRNQVGSFVVSIAHYMRAYFNQQALLNGNDFKLPGDAGYLNCVLLQETEYAEQRLYAKIGCMERETFTSTKLQLHVYTDKQCSEPYDDGQSKKRHATKGYEINKYIFSTKVTFRPPFYSCQACNPEQISNTFNKKNGNWYDDDYISEHGKKQNDDNVDDNVAGDDAAYMYSNDDVNADDDARYYVNNDDVADDGYANDDGGNNNNDDGDDYFNYNDDYNRVRHRGLVKEFSAAPGELEAYHQTFWEDFERTKRSLYENNYDIGNWNMCEKVHKYGVWCDAACRALDTFRVDEWSKSDIFLLVTLCLFMAAMMLLVVAKRLKAAQRARLYGDDNYKPGLPPLGMSLIFLCIMTIIVVLAKYKFVNETLVFAVVTCILLFIYMLKLTLFETRRPVLLAAPRHDLFDNPLDDRLFS